MPPILPWGGWKIEKKKNENEGAGEKIRMGKGKKETVSVI